ncbi:MAG TPA: class I SAM-dependent methyltransferase, partial [Mycobacteriales bacterium]|nr:class I SAM-dependent methyltransferase [Mycobacteriales bacterium]
MTEWFTTFFDSLANEFWEAAMPPHLTEEEVAYLTRALRLADGSTVLDVPCNRGRHALALAHAGVRVIGVDLSSEAVGVLRERGAQSDLPVVTHVADMRTFDVGPVDAAYTLGNSLGYFAPADIGRFFSRVAGSVVPGGRYVVDSSMVAECVLPHFELESSHEAGGITMSDRHRYDVRESRLDTTVTFERGGEADAREMSHWVLTAREVVQLLEGAGFDVEELYGDIDEVPFEIGSPRL